MTSSEVIVAGVTVTLIVIGSAGRYSVVPAAEIVMSDVPTPFAVTFPAVSTETAASLLLLKDRSPYAPLTWIIALLP